MVSASVHQHTIQHIYCCLFASCVLYFGFQHVFWSAHPCADCLWFSLQVAGKLDSADKEKIEKEVEGAISWLDQNQMAEKDEIEHQLQELEGDCSPIISKMYQAGGGAPGNTSWNAPSHLYAIAVCHVMAYCIAPIYCI